MKFSQKENLKMLSNAPLNKFINVLESHRGKIHKICPVYCKIFKDNVLVQIITADAEKRVFIFPIVKDVKKKNVLVVSSKYAGFM